MLNFNIDKDRLKDAISNVSTWEDWYKLEEEFFKSSEWKETDLDTLDKDLERPIISIDGFEWEPTTSSYDLPHEVFHLYEKTRLEVFAILEPEAALENKAHPEWYAKWCICCRRWSRNYPKDTCPECKNELLPLTLNEK